MAEGVWARIARTWPALPYMSLGFVLASIYLASSGTAWPSDTEVNGSSISILFIATTLSSGAVMALVAACAHKAAGWVAQSRVCLIASLVAAFANLAIIVIGPYYLTPHLPVEAVMTAFIVSGILFGGSMGIIGLRCAQLYGALPPRQVIVYAALSQVIVAAVFFFVVGSPSWAPVQGGPSLAGIISFVALPLVSGFLLSLANHAEDADGEVVCYDDTARSLPRSFWKLLAVVFVFSCIVSSVYSQMVASSPVDVTLDSTRLVMTLRAALAVGLVVAAIGTEGARLNFGKTYSIIMVVSVALVACLPLVTVLNTVLTQIVSLASVVFELFLWCTLAFIVYQRRISVAIVFGYGYGAYLVGTGLGWLVGARMLGELIAVIGGTFAYMVMAILVLACAFLIFSEREFDALFASDTESMPTLEDLLARDYAVELEAAAADGAEPSGKKRRFAEAIDELAESYQLSPREADVLRCVAMGYDSDTMADKLCLAWNTVRTYRRNVYGKMGVHSRQELMKLVEDIVAKA